MTITDSFDLTEPEEAPAVDSGGERRRVGANLIVGAAIVLTIVATALLSFLWTPFDPTRVEVPDRLKGMGWEGHLLGTDQVGHDILSQLMVGARNTLFVGILAVGIALVVGVPLGGLAAARRGWVEESVMRLSDVIYAFPAILLAILLSAARGPGISSAMIAIGVAYIPIVARVTRGASLAVFQTDYIRAAYSYGRGRTYVFVRHVLPNISSVLIVQATVLFALAILAEAALSYLGLGVQPPAPSWGGSLVAAQTFFRIKASLAFFPGLAIAISVVGFNLLGDGIRDFLDPKLAEKT
ncbi:MAG: ABC transporter permease [Acidimicrobiales bacterium]